jgi:gluconolactonase
VSAEFEELAAGFNHPEGVAWDPAGGCVYAGGEGGEIYGITLDGEVVELVVTGGSMLGIAVDGSGRVYACDDGNGEIVRLDAESGALATYARAPGGEELDTPNMAAFGPDGTLYVTCSGEGGDPSIVRVPPGGGDAEVWCREVSRYPNGCLVTPDGDALVVVESRAQRLVRVPIERDGSAGAVEVLAKLPDTDADGVAMDAGGAMWVTLYRPDGIVRVADGRVETVVDDRLARTFDAPTNLAFVGESLDRAVVANVGDRFLSIGDLGVRGQPLHRPEVP